VLSKPREVRASVKTATTQLAAEFRSADAVLADRMDNLIPQLRSAHRGFATDYQNARRIVRDAAGRERKKPEPPSPSR
jgi:hypothetical protein